MPDLPERPTVLNSKNISPSTIEYPSHRSPYQHLIDHFPDVLFRYKVQLPAGFDYINPAMIGMTGISPEDCIHDPSFFFDRVHPQDRPLLEDCLIKLKCIDPLVIRWLKKDGTLVWTELRSIPVIDPAGKIVAIEGIVRDLSHPPSPLQDVQSKNSIVPHLIALGKALEKPASLYELAEIIGTSVQQLCSADAGILLKLSPNHQALCLWADGIGDNRVKVTAQKVYLALKDNPVDPTHLWFIKDPEDESGQFCSMIVCPLVYEKKLLGGLACFQMHKRTIEDQELKSIEAFAAPGSHGTGERPARSPAAGNLPANCLSLDKNHEGQGRLYLRPLPPISRLG